jgi:hypothetical protein
MRAFSTLLESPRPYTPRKRRPAIGELPNLLVDSSFRKCVALLYVESTTDSGERGFSPCGTAFFVGFQTEGVVYAVTARHVVDSSRPRGPLFLGVRTRSAGMVSLQVPEDAWDSLPRTDVSVARVALPKDNDVIVIGTNDLADDGYVVQEQIGEGDELFLCGLFASSVGITEPIVRFGHIALARRQLIPLELSKGEAAIPTDAYLAEAQSYGGQSGSPAFVYLSPNRFPGRFVSQMTIGGPPSMKAQLNMALLGVVHGHVPLMEEIEWERESEMPSAHIDVNAGISAVIPAQKILDTLMIEELREDRERTLEEIKRNDPPLARPDTTSD